jgi:hypothetical protein
MAKKLVFGMMGLALWCLVTGCRTEWEPNTGTGGTVTAGRGYNKATKLNGEFEVVKVPVPETDAAVGEGKIAYRFADKKLWAGKDRAVTLNPTLDADLIVDLDVIFDPINGLKTTSIGINTHGKVKFVSGAPALVTLVDPLNGAEARNLLTKADIIVAAGSFIFVPPGQVLVIPPGKSITLKQGTYISLRPGDASTSGGTLITGASSGREALAIKETNARGKELIATGNSAFETSVDMFNGITTTPAAVQSIRSGGFLVIIQADTRDGVVSAATTFKDGS